MQIFELTCRENIDTIIEKFVDSGNWFDSAKNTELLIRVVSDLTETQWKIIFEAFFENDQIFGSYGCNTKFETLFEKSLEITSSVPSYWILFKDRLPEYKDRKSNKLKRLIESHLF